MKFPHRQLKTEMWDVALDHEKKIAIKQRLMREMAAHPVRESDPERLLRRKPLLLRPMPIAALILSMLVSGGTAVAAETSVPGDVLYPVKTEITEELRGAFIFDEEKRAEWAEKRVERRLDELDRLEAEGKLDAEKRAELEARLTDRVERANERFEQLKEKHPEAADRLQNRMHDSFKKKHRGHISDEVREEMRERFKDMTPEERREAKQELKDELRAHRNTQTDTE